MALCSRHLNPRYHFDTVGWRLIQCLKSAANYIVIGNCDYIQWGMMSCVLQDRGYGTGSVITVRGVNMKISEAHISSRSVE